MVKEIKVLAKRYSDEQLAVKIGVSVKTIYNWRTEKTEPYRRDQAKILELYKTEVDKDNSLR